MNNEDWISTKDELPIVEENKGYPRIIFLVDEYIHFGYYYDSGYSGEFTQDPTENTFYGESYKKEEVSHWMPYPKLPNGDIAKNS